MRARLHANSEVVGTDESFFDDDQHNKAVTDLYHEKAGLLDGEDDSEVDLVSYAYQIWQRVMPSRRNLRSLKKPLTIEDVLAERGLYGQRAQSHRALDSGSIGVFEDG